MTLWELLIVAAGLSMDAFAVSVCKGLAVTKATFKHSIPAGLYFGIFQAMMPAAGYLLGAGFSAAVSDADHWIAFLLLTAIGGKMAVDSGRETEQPNASFAPRAMLPLAVATSIDALAVGAGFAFLNVRIVPAVCLIGAVTFILSAAGVQLGARFGSRLRKRAELTGGVILILMGAKILMEHLTAHI